MAEIPRVGVTLKAIEGFRARLAEASHSGATEGLPTAAVSALAMAQVTSERRCSYAALLDPADASLVGEANVFVSHAWAMPFDALVAALRDTDASLRAREPELGVPYFWLDLLVNDQFLAPEREFAWWQTVFRENVRRIGRTVLVLEWERPLPLVRIWCVWEMFCASQASAEAASSAGTEGAAAETTAPRARAGLELAMPPASRLALETALIANFDSLAAKLCRIDLGSADAFHGGFGPGSCEFNVNKDGSVGCPAVAAGSSCPNDRAQILDAIAAAPGGVDGVTKVVIGALRGWMARTAREFLVAIEDRDERATSDLQLNCARFLKDSGWLNEAELLMRESVEVKRRVLGNNHASTAASVHDLGSLLHSLGDLANAEAMVREALSATRSQDAGGALSGALTSIMSSLGSVLQSRGDLAGAEVFVREALERQRRSLGGVQLATLASINNLGSLLQARGDLVGAEALMREALEARRLVLSDAHPDTLATMHSLGVLLQVRGKFPGSEELLRKGLQLSRRTLGDTHQQTRAFSESLELLVRVQDGDAGAQTPPSTTASGSPWERVCNARERLAGIFLLDAAAAPTLLVGSGVYTAAEPYAAPTCAGGVSALLATSAPDQRLLASSIVAELADALAALNKSETRTSALFDGVAASLGSESAAAAAALSLLATHLTAVPPRILPSPTLSGADAADAALALCDAFVFARIGSYNMNASGKLNRHDDPKARVRVRSLAAVAAHERWTCAALQEMPKDAFGFEAYRSLMRSEPFFGSRWAVEAGSSDKGVQGGEAPCFIYDTRCLSAVGGIVQLSPDSGSSSLDAGSSADGCSSEEEKDKEKEAAARAFLRRPALLFLRSVAQPDRFLALISGHFTARTDGACAEAKLLGSTALPWVRARAKAVGLSEGRYVTVIAGSFNLSARRGGRPDPGDAWGALTSAAGGFNPVDFGDGAPRATNVHEFIAKRTPAEFDHAFVSRSECAAWPLRASARVCNVAEPPFSSYAADRAALRAQIDALSGPLAGDQLRNEALALAMQRLEELPKRAQSEHEGRFGDHKPVTALLLTFPPAATA